MPMLAGALTSFGSDGYLGTPIFKGSVSAAKTAANVRRSYLLSILEHHRDSPPRREVIEKPPGYEDTPESSEPLDDISAAAQLADLEYQISSEQALLLGRLTDAMVCIARRRSRRTKQDVPCADVDVAVRPISWWERRRQSFPWVAVVGTNCPELFREPLLDLKDWIGIGVNLRPASNLQEHSEKLEIVLLPSPIQQKHS